MLYLIIIIIINPILIQVYPVPPLCWKLSSIIRHYYVILQTREKGIWKHFETFIKIDLAISFQDFLDIAVLLGQDFQFTTYREGKNPKKLPKELGIPIAKSLKRKVIIYKCISPWHKKDQNLIQTVLQIQFQGLKGHHMSPIQRGLYVMMQLYWTNMDSEPRPHSWKACALTIAPSFLFQKQTTLLLKTWRQE